MIRTLIRKYADPGFTVDVYCFQKYHSTKTFKTIDEVKQFVTPLGRHPETDIELGFPNFSFYRIVEHSDGFYEIEFEPGELTPPE